MCGWISVNVLQTGRRDLGLEQSQFLTMCCDALREYRILKKTDPGSVPGSAIY